MKRYILSLPPELLVKSLEGLSVEDVVRVAQTCSKFRSLIKSNKATLCATSDSHMLKLPLDRPLNTVPSELLHIRAVQSLKTASHIARRPLDLREKISIPISGPGLEYDPANPPANFFTHKNILVFRCQSRLVIMEMVEAGVIDKIVHFQLEIGEYRYHIGYRLSEDESTLHVVSLAYQPKQKVSSLQVREICISNRAFGETTFLFRFGLPASEPKSVSIRDPYAAIVTHVNCIIVDWRRELGIILVVKDPARIERHPMHTKYSNRGIELIHFHPIESSMILSSTYSDGEGEAKFYTKSIPSDMTPLDRSGKESSKESSWITRTIRPRALPCYTAGPDVDFYCELVPMGFRRLPDSTWVFQAVGYTPSTNGHPGHVIGEPSPVFQVLYDVSNWTYQTDFLDITLTGEEGDLFFPMGNYRGGGQVIFPLVDVTTQDDDGYIIVPEFGNGSQHDVGWVKLKVSGLPKKHRSEDQMPDVEYWKAIFPAVDLVTRRLYLCLPKGFFVYEY
ncbi:hypothetical protein SISSUDRAFT_1060437 [Sistotremastrum suecicum HHB10207 ss-3]|uniref:F-box domain-containing protein n=1 Tax=Sistotremastrum suecicum HHB10207 ss-3 TaxID=1314776 RepID=A0A166F305_9AGAM|nr:hypothetical protein SISSUDRAFT_1060437 [Sistotremastrum suecicum HHB10207 ss-3]